MESDDSENGSSSSESSKSNSSSSNSIPSTPSSPAPDDQFKSDEVKNVEREDLVRGVDIPFSPSGSNPRSPSISESESETSGSEQENEQEQENENENEYSKNNEISSPSNDNTNRSRRSSLSSSLSENSLGGADNIDHEDLSDVSDLESDKQNSIMPKIDQSGDDITNGLAPDKKEDCYDDGEYQSKNNGEVHDASPVKDIVQENTVQMVPASSNKSPVAEIDDLVKTNDEDALDFEAEEGECPEVVKEETNEVAVEEENKKTEEEEASNKADQELEEGEVTDEDEKRPEETEPKPVCRFFTRGQCTWGMSCRFLHPGVTDKGNYTMFENMVRSVPVAQTSISGRAPPYGAHLLDYHEYRTERPPIIHRPGMHHSVNLYGGHQESRTLLPDTPIVVENAWERGLRTAKEMMRKANKKKEQDMDFDDKKMNLTVSPDDIEKEPYFHKERVSPPDFMYEHPDRYGRPPHPGVPYEEIDNYGRSNRYRELPPHRMPHYEDERRVRPTREVIVQRVETNSRGDEWNDPWMRSKSPGFRGVSRERGEKRHRDRHSYSSNSSYSSSNSSQSGSSSDSSRSSSQENSRSRYKRNPQTSPNFNRKHAGRPVRSPSQTGHRLRHSPGTRTSPLTKKRKMTSASMERRMNSPSYKKKRKSPHLNMKAYSKKSKGKRMQTSSSSGSDSSSNSSSSESDSDSVSSSTDSSSRGRSPPKRSRIMEKLSHEKRSSRRADSQKKRSPISIELKKPVTVGTSALLSPTHSVSSEREPKKSRREELLKQLRAVEDAIAKKRSKLS